jgi:hypothetical protein
VLSQHEARRMLPAAPRPSKCAPSITRRPSGAEMQGRSDLSRETSRRTEAGAWIGRAAGHSRLLFFSSFFFSAAPSDARGAGELFPKPAPESRLYQACAFLVSPAGDTTRLPDANAERLLEMRAAR